MLQAGVALFLSHKANQRSDSRRLRAVEKRMGDWDDYLPQLVNSYDKTHESIKAINQRLTMRDRRSKKKNETDSDIPDPAVDPQGWRAAMRVKYPQGALSVLNGGRPNGPE